MTPHPSRLDLLARRNRLLWGLTFAVVLALAAAIPVLYLPTHQALSERGEAAGLESHVALVALGGLIALFVLYTLLKQRELERMRRRLLEQQREEEGIRTRLSELSALFQVSTTLNLQLRLEVILEIIVRRVVSTLRAQQASVMIFNPETGVLETRAAYGLESEYARNARKRLGEGIAGWVAERQEAVLLSDAVGAPAGLDRHFKLNRNITSAVSLPLRVGERCIGVLNVNRINHPETFGDQHRELLQMFAEHVGAVIDRAETMERLGSRTRELEADNQRLAQVNRLKDVFLSTTSHELKTPLTSVIAYAELLEDADRRLDPDQRGEFLRRLRSEAGRLLSLIEDILDLNRLESGKMVLKRAAVPLAEVVRTAVQTTRATAEKRGIAIEEVHAEDLPPLVVDEVKLRQVVVNLLVNAAKFSPEGGTVRVRSARDGDFVRVEVQDEGPGVRPEDAATIFELFGQGVAEPGGRGGVGIGLHLVKRISELHGGHVGVNSVAGQGSTFWVRLPLALAEVAPASEDAPARAA
jgi:signal transduction histidine kinase